MVTGPQARPLRRRPAADAPPPTAPTECPAAAVAGRGGKEGRHVSRCDTAGLLGTRRGQGGPPVVLPSGPQDKDEGGPRTVGRRCHRFHRCCPAGNGPAEARAGCACPRLPPRTTGTASWTSAGGPPRLRRIRLLAPVCGAACQLQHCVCGGIIIIIIIITTTSSSSSSSSSSSITISITILVKI